MLQDRNPSYSLSRHHKKHAGDQWTKCCRTGIHDLPTVEASQKANRWSVDRMLQDRNPWLTCCWGITESKQDISGQNVAGQESMTYRLSKHHRKQTGDQWTEYCRTGIHDLHPVGGSQKANRWSVDRMLQDRNPWLTRCWGIRESKQVISGQNCRNPWLTSCQGITESKQVSKGQNVAGQESITYPLSKHHRQQTGDKQTEFCRTGIHDLPPVRASHKAYRWLVDKMIQDRNPWLTRCKVIRESKQVISGQIIARQEPMIYLLSRHHRKQTGEQWIECCKTGIHDLPPVKGITESKQGDQQTECWRTGIHDW
jgi:hypothetical protein